MDDLLSHRESDGKKNKVPSHGMKATGNDDGVFEHTVPFLET